MRRASLRAALCVVFLWSVSGCASIEQPGALAEKQGFIKTSIKADVFRLAAYLRVTAEGGDTLAVYIEGDGAPWITSYHPPRDPTPQNPISLDLAAADSSSKVAYLGRPCQYLDAESLRSCNSAYWTGQRFAPKVIAAYDDALTQLKASLGVKRLRLVGYSGGGVIATLLASQRADVELLITVAAPLATAEWVIWHGAAPLTGSLDPADLGVDKSLPESVHFVGANDKIVPAPIVEKFIRTKGGHMEIVAGFGHDCCWARDWVKLLGQVKEKAK